MNTDNFPKYEYNGARSLIILHEMHINAFFNTWLKAKSLNIRLPKTDDTDYASLETLLTHVLRSSGGYISWICEKLNVTAPHIKKPPELNNLEKEAKEYIIHLLESWRTPLNKIKEKEFYSPSFKSNWGSEYCIDAMLEHAVMHPLRHEFQLNNLIVQQS